MKHRLDRVNEILKRELGEIVRREIQFDAPLVTIQAVDVTPDLKNAHVWISVIGNLAQRKQAMAALHAARKELQRETSKRVILKFTPHFHFRLDEASERGDRVLQILEKIGPLPIEESEADKEAQEQEEFETNILAFPVAPQDSATSKSDVADDADDDDDDADDDDDDDDDADDDDDDDDDADDDDADDDDADDDNAKGKAVSNPPPKGRGGKK